MKQPIFRIYTTVLDLMEANSKSCSHCWFFFYEEKLINRLSKTSINSRIPFRKNYITGIRIRIMNSNKQILHLKRVQNGIHFTKHYMDWVVWHLLGSFGQVRWLVENLNNMYKMKQKIYILFQRPQNFQYERRYLTNEINML